MAELSALADGAASSFTVEIGSIGSSRNPFARFGREM